MPLNTAIGLFSLFVRRSTRDSISGLRGVPKAKRLRGDELSHREEMNEASQESTQDEALPDALGIPNVLISHGRQLTHSRRQ